jgi:hypothetical protein
MKCVKVESYGIETCKPGLVGGGLWQVAVTPPPPTMDLRLATLKAISFYLLHNVSRLNQSRKLSCGTVVCKHFANYQDDPNY